MKSWRSGDEYFDIGGRVLSATLEVLYPELRGYQNYILEEEIRNPPTSEVLRLRSEHFVYIPGAYGEQERLSKFEKKHPNLLFENKKTSKILVKEIIGQTAYEGESIRGLVRVVRNLRHVLEVQEGEIIVSPMTIPEFLPAMKRASAFITDEGGMLCHAAIVARELKKPCIIGTKIATKVLKDGDLVEVDVENGVVKIIKKESIVNI